MTRDPLRTRDGRPPRVALLVYNDAHADARVIKTAESLRAGGADVRILAVERTLNGRPAGAGVVGDGVPVHRSPEFDLVRQAPGLVQALRRIAERSGIPPGVLPGTVAPPAGRASASTGAVAEDPGGEREPAPPTSTTGRGRALTRRLLRLGEEAWLRFFSTAGLVQYWSYTAVEGRRWRPDVIHANDANTLVPAQLIARTTGARIVYDSHELWRHRHARSGRILAPHVEAAIESTVIRRACGVITVSDSIAGWLQETYRLTERPTLVRNIPRAAASPPGREDGRLHELAGLDDEARVIAYGGRITPSRGVEETVDALVHLPEDVHFVILGYGGQAYLSQIRRRATTLGVGDRVHLVGSVASDQVATALADGDVAVVHVHPTCLSHRFSLPNKLFESIHAGVPVVAADLPDRAEIVRARGVGEIFDDDSPRALAATIAAVLAAPQAYRDAAHRAAEDLTWQHEETRLLDLYRRCLA